VFPAVKIEAAMVWKTVFAVEMVAMPSGLGYLAMLYADLLDVTHVAAIVAVLTLTVIGIVHFVTFMEKRILTERGFGVESWQYVLEL
jgi:ABC-type nitrate/sulfonate/bicarbonate transport system permease component